MVVDRNWGRVTCRTLLAPTVTTVDACTHPAVTRAPRAHRSSAGCAQMAARWHCMAVAK
jgi:hypothetical protein